MVKQLKFFIAFFSVFSCIEPYEFTIHNDDPTIVIEALISDKSFNEAIGYPSDGRYFTAKVSKTSSVTNTRPEPVEGASIQLLCSDGNAWAYTEKSAGTFELVNNDFKALSGLNYKLRVILQNEDVYESDWQALPEETPPPMGEIDFYETEQQFYVMESSEWALRSFKGVMVRINVNKNTAGKALHYRWTFSPTWIYKAPLSSVVDPGNICWATDKNYLNTYLLQVDRTGGYSKDLFFFRTIRNERIFEKMSVLVTQYVMTDEYFNFWREMNEQNEGGRLNEKPPYNLHTNYHSTADGIPVSGFFGVVREEAKRWYFSRHDLSYFVANTLKPDCLVDYGGPPAAECTDCRAYSFGVATTTKPQWWE